MLRRCLDLASIYFSAQFGKYVICGIIASAAHLIARWVFNHFMSFPAAVFCSYFVGMPVAFLMYRFFVFSGAGSAREWVLFALTYFGFLPVTWVLSVVTEPVFLRFFEAEPARLSAHMVGVVIPVLLNFAYNKFVTFRKKSGHVARSHPRPAANQTRTD